MKTMNKYKLILAGALALGLNSDARADYIQHLSEVYNIPLERLQALRGDMFNDLNLRGVIKSKDGNTSFTYDLRDSSFVQYLTSKFGDEGKTVYEFLNQGRTEEFGVSRDIATGSIFLNRMIVTPDSVEAVSLPITNRDLGDFMNQFALGINSSLSAIHRIRDDKKKIEFEIVGGAGKGGFDYERENLPNNVLKSAIPGFKFMTEEEANKFYSESGIQDGLVDVLTPDQGNVSLVRTFETDINSRLHIEYSIDDSQAVTLVELRLPENIPNGASYLSELPALPETRLSFSDGQIRSLGLEQIIVAGASVIPPQPPQPPQPTVQLPNQISNQDQADTTVGKTGRANLALRIWSGIGTESTVGVGIGDRFFVDVFAGYGLIKSGDNESSMVPGTETPNGSRIDFSRYVEEQNVASYIAGLSIGGRIKRGWHFAVEPNLTVRYADETGNLTPQTYHNGEFIRNGNPQPIFEKTRKVYPGVSGRIGKDRVSLHTGLNSGKEVRALLSYQFGRK